MAGSYDVAQICENGHTINRSSQRHPAHNKRFCPKCGAATITGCPQCSAAILGEYHVDGVIGGFREPPPPSYCHECGAAYPWTQMSLQELRAVAAGASRLSEDERGELADDLESMVRETPGHQRKVNRAAELLQKAGAGAYEAAKDILAGIATEYAKKALGM